LVCSENFVSNRTKINNKVSGSTIIQMAAESLCVEIAGVKLCFRTDHADLASYARLHLSPLEVHGQDDADILAELVWLEGLPPREAASVFPETNSLDRIERDIYRGKECVVLMRIDDFRDLKMRFVLEGNRLKVTGYYYFHLSKEPLRNSVKRAVYRGRLFTERQRKFTTLLYYLVYYPCLWWLETRRGIHPLHGGAVATAKGGILLAGAGGVGKSTLTVALTTLRGAHWLSDTFVLYDEFRLYPMVEPILLDQWSRHWVERGMDSLRDITQSRNYGYGRKAFHMDPSLCAGSTAASLVLLPYRSDHSSVKRLSALECAAMIRAYYEITGDLRRYWVLSASLGFLDGHTGLAEHRAAALRCLLVNASCYEVGFDSGTGREELLDHILSLMS
jgi:hypothetical protein